MSITFCIGAKQQLVLILDANFSGKKSSHRQTGKRYLKLVEIETKLANRELESN